MNDKTLTLLDFGEVMDAVSRRALCPETAERLRQERPRALEGEAGEIREAVRAVWGRIAAGEDYTGEGLPEAGAALALLGVPGAALGEEDALALGLFLERGAALRDRLLEPGGEVPAFGPLPGCLGTASEIFSVIDHEGRVRDLPPLREIRSRILRLQNELDREAASFRDDPEKRGMLRSSLPSQRDGRLVLAVKAAFRGRVRGIVRGASSTGETVFIEPEGAVEKNNALTIEQRRLDAEKRRILRDLAASLASRLEGEDGGLRRFREGILFLDSLRAKAMYGAGTGGLFAASPPGGGRLILKGARHPLLGEKAVPIDLSMEKRLGDGKTGPIRTLIITGANAGGKTVALKTAGLFVLMNQTGLPVPALEGTSIPFFDGVFADIGDGQSLRDSLSTFSGHMEAIAGILEAAGKRSLVLLDEPGAGTDPQEGSAIAMAVLDHLAMRGAAVIATSHHGTLKHYAWTRSEAENACVEFDPVTLAPAFRLVMGLPGESRALDIAERRGLPAPIVALARSYMAGDGGGSDIAALITSLIEKKRVMEESIRASEEEARRLAEARREVQAREARLLERELAIRKEGMGGLRAFLGESGKRLENLVAELREGEITREKTLKTKEFLRDLDGRLREEEEASEADEKALQALRAFKGDVESEGPGERASGGGDWEVRPGGELKPGAEVLILPPGGGAGGKACEKRRGRVIRSARPEGGERRWVVETSSLRLTLPERSLAPASPSGGTSVAASPGALITLPQTAEAGRGASMELDLRGMRLPEAIEALEKHLDWAVLTGLGEFAVIHGLGEGVLQQGVRSCLAASPVVAEFHFSRPEHGGFGRTEVVLK